jgi:predicted nucleotidyltransferase
MKNMSSKVRLDPLVYAVLERVNTAAQALGLPYLVIGASARMLLLEQVYGLPEGRRTLDLDFAIQVRDWPDFKRLRSELLQMEAFAPVQSPVHRLRYRNTMILDIVPFGSGIENADGEIEWPGENTVMNVLSLGSFLATAVKVNLDGGLSVPVISPEGLFVAKLFAWQDRRLASPGRDAADMAYLLRYVIDIVGTDTLYDEHIGVMEAVDYNPELAAATVFGASAAKPLSVHARRMLAQVLNQAVEEGIDSSLVYDLERYGNLSGPERVLGLITALRNGVTG